MNWRLFGGLLTIVLLISSCSPSAYSSKHDTFLGMYGYEETPIDSLTYQVVYSGDNTQPKDLVDRYALFRSAELTVEKGYDYFVILDGDRSTRTDETVLAGSPINDTHIEHTTDTWTGQTIPVAVTTSHSSNYVSRTDYHTCTKTIRLGKGARPKDAYDAKSMMSTMGPKVKR